MTWEELVAIIRELNGSWRTFSRKVPGIAFIPGSPRVPASKGKAAIPGSPSTPGRSETMEIVYEITLPDENGILKPIGEFVNPDEGEAALEAYVRQRFERAATKKAEKEEKQKEKAAEAKEKEEFEKRKEQRGSEAKAAEKRAEAEAKARTSAAEAPYANPVQPPPFAPPAGHRWQWDEPRKRWSPVEVPKPQRPRSLEEALTFGTEEEINRFLSAQAALDLPSAAETEKQQYEREQALGQRLFQNKLSLRDQELQEQDAAIQLARSPGDYALWWNLLSGQGTGTPKDFDLFQRSGVRAGLYPPGQGEAEGFGGEPAGAPRQGETPEQVATVLQGFIAQGGTEGMSPKQLEITNQAWTERYRRAEAASQPQASAPLALPQPAAPGPVMTPEEEAQYQAFVDAGDEETADTVLRQAQARGSRVNAPRFSAQNRQPGALSLAEAQQAQRGGTLPREALFPGLGGQQAQPPQVQARGPAGAPNWMQVLFARSPQLIQYLQDIQAGRPAGQRRTIPNITGQPFPSAQTFNRLTPSQQAGFFGQYGAGAVPQQDLLNEFQRTTAGFPNMPRRLLFRPRATNAA